MHSEVLGVGGCLPWAGLVWGSALPGCLATGGCQAAVLFLPLQIQTSESHALRQFHFTSWPDHGVPDTTDLLINFRYLVRDYMKQSPPESPILVHCRYSEGTVVRWIPGAVVCLGVCKPKKGLGMGP